MKIAIISENQIEYLKQSLEMLKLFSEIDTNSIIIIDYKSEDGTSDWLNSQNEYSFLLCNDNETYGEILNVVIKEFVENEDLLVVSPNYIVLPFSIDNLINETFEEKIGALSPVSCNQMLSSPNNYSEAVDFASSYKSEGRLEKTIGINPFLILLKDKLITENGSFNEGLKSPYSTITDYLLRGITNDFSYYKMKTSLFFELKKQNASIHDLNHREDLVVLNGIWGMQYLNINPNLKLYNVFPNIENDANILEVGCDCGANLLEIKNRYPTANLYGIELNPNAAKIANYFGKVVSGNIEDKNIDFNVKFDIIIFADVLEHLRDPKATVNYCKDLLRSKGKIITCIPNLMHFSIMMDLIRNGNFTYDEVGLMDHTHIHLFTYNEIINLFNDTGFKVTDIISIGTGAAKTPERQEFIQKLVSLSEKVEPFMYETYEYLICAEID